MKIFVSEFVVGGAWTGGEVPVSLAREGYSMWAAVLSDLARIDDCQVLTTRDSRYESPGIRGVCEIVVQTPAEERQQLIELVQHTDIAMLIAPELDDQLTQRVEIAERAGTRVRLLNADSATTRLCSDKLLLADFLAGAGIDTPSCYLISRGTPLDAAGIPLGFPMVIKPRFGAGSCNVRLIRNAREWSAETARADAAFPGDLVAQPCVSGQAMSIAAMRRQHGASWEVLPLARQMLSDDGSFEYHGGCVPVEMDAGPVCHLVNAVMSRLPSLVGYVGFDLVIPASDPARPVLIEINPRMTTSYLGYRALSRENLLERLLDISSHQESIAWNAGQVSYAPNGELHWAHREQVAHS